MLKELGKNAINIIVAHKAQIAIGAGIIGNGVAVALACKQTLTAKDIVNDHNERREEITEAKIICNREIKIYETAKNEDSNAETLQEPCSTEKYEAYKKYLDAGYKKDLAITYGKTGLKFAKHYVVPAAIFVASNVLIAVGAGIMTRNIAGLTSALATTTTAFSNYRERVKQAIGEEAENRIFTNEQVITKTVTEVDDEGNETEKEQQVVTVNGDNSQYAVKLTRACYPYCNDILKTLSNIKEIEADLNRQLIGKGIVTLNEVFEKLGLRKTAAGQLVGWVYSQNPEEQEKHGDGYISFGVFDHVDENGNVSSAPMGLNDQWEEILKSHEGSMRYNDTDEYDIWLFFNVDGVITQYMDQVPGQPI